MTDSTDTVFVASFAREARISADRQRITHRAMDWSADYTPQTLLTWIDFYAMLAEDHRMPLAKADLEVLCAVRDFLAAC